MNSRSIPEEIKRTLRQQSGFGCCVCGFPIFDYHHILPFASERTHDREQMMVLCPNHHRQATEGALTLTEQRHWKHSPVNMKNGFVSGNLVIPNPILAIESARRAIVGPFAYLVDGEPIFVVDRYPDGRLKLTLQLYDRDENLLFSVIDNEWISGDPAPWDFECRYQWIRMRSSDRNLVISVDARGKYVRLHAELWRKDFRLSFQDEDIALDHAQGGPSLQAAYTVFIGMALMCDSEQKSVELGPVIRSVGGAILTTGVPENNIQRGIQEWEKLSISWIYRDFMRRTMNPW